MTPAPRTAPQGASSKERASGAGPDLETCPLCGDAFDATGRGCRPSCPMAKGCSVVCCPRCGYSFPQETGLAGALRRLLDRRKKRRPNAP